MKPYSVIMLPQWAAHHLTRRAIRKYPNIPETDNEAYLNLFSGVQNIMAGAAANGELQLVAFPLWWPIPAHMAVDDDGRIVQGAGVTDTALYEWMKSFDADIIANKQTAEDFWKELQGDDASTEPEAVTDGGVRIVGDFRHGEKDRWYRDNAFAFALAAGRAGCRLTAIGVAAWIKGNIPEAKASSTETWRTKHLTADLLEQVQATLNQERGIVKSEN